MVRWMLCAALGAAALAAVSSPSDAADKSDRQVKRGEYLVALGGCLDCHTSGYFLGKPDMARFLGGSDVGFYIPHAGTFYGPNLTPDKETGLGNWSAAQIVAALQTGKRPDGRMLAPVMPWRSFARLTKSDAHAIAAFLKSLPAVSNKVPGPFGADQAPSSFALKVVPPGEVLTPK
jgi:mono/diheme cytochrome c family protein